MAMSKGMKIGCGVGVGLIIVAIIFISSIVGVYNNLVTLDEQVTQSWSQVENQYQRRTDLIPNLVNTVKGVYSYINLFEGLEKNIVPFKNYSPPLIVTDIQVLDQVFLI